MKLVILLVVLLSVYMANSRDFLKLSEKHKGVEGEDSPGESEKHDLAEGAQYMQDRPDKYESPGGSEYDPIDVEQQLRKIVFETNGNGLDGKMTKRILQRFGTNPISMKHTLSQAELLYFYIVINLELKKELQSIREQQNNITDSGKKFKIELQTKLENITKGDMQFKLELQSMKDKQNNITDTNTDMILELKSIKNQQDNITGDNSEVKMELKSIKGVIADLKQDMTKYNSLIMSKLNSSLSNQAAKLIYPSRSTTKLSWQASVKKCEDMGAQPFIPRTRQDFEIIRQTRIELAYYMWLPASDVAQEGSLRWYNGQDASKSAGLVWESNKEMYSNSATRDCLLFGSDTNGVHLYPCSSTVFPMICSRYK